MTASPGSRTDAVRLRAAVARLLAVLTLVVVTAALGPVPAAGASAPDPASQVSWSVSPASAEGPDGRRTIDVAVPPAELDLGTEPLPRVSIFLSVLDVHVQRVPVSGEGIDVVHKAGQFLSADLADASVVNERTSMHLRTPAGHDLAVVQIAGLLARRIVNQASAGDTLTIGDTYGLIRFGSRVDTYFPEGSRLAVLPGQRAVGAETVLAELP